MKLHLELVAYGGIIFGIIEVTVARFFFIHGYLMGEFVVCVVFESWCCMHEQTVFLYKDQVPI